MNRALARDVLAALFAASLVACSLRDVDEYTSGGPLTDAGVKDTSAGGDSSLAGAGGKGGTGGKNVGGSGHGGANEGGSGGVAQGGTGGGTGGIGPGGTGGIGPGGTGGIGPGGTGGIGPGGTGGIGPGGTGGIGPGGTGGIGPGGSGGTEMGGTAGGGVGGSAGCQPTLDPSAFAFKEIVSNMLPMSIEGWAEAFCSGSVNYVCPNGYSRVSCVQDPTLGTHDGCSVCVMVKVLCQCP